MTIREIREKFLEYFKAHEHKVLPSASLLPTDDPTLLFTTAGMVPFKPYFSGVKTPPSKRLATVQKCLRTTDLEEVGKTARHLSMFEMLGNFSFGDYFKKEAIRFSWEVSTQIFKIPQEKIWISVYLDDDEAYNLWYHDIGVPKKRIVRLGKEDNFWGPAGVTGACGPCSELYLDRGEKFGNGPENQSPGGEGDRFMEFWNLVFNQFNFDGNNFEPLKKTGIDTGAGLERLATLLQNVNSVYETDELKQLLNSIALLYKVEYNSENQNALQVLTDHVRCLVFAMADGIFPSNESRGYVLRRVLRRALMFGRQLGQKKPQLYLMVKKVTSIYGNFYKELPQTVEMICNFIQSEEERFLSTLEAGNDRFTTFLEVAQKSQKQISGKEAFLLYDTFGFPLEMTVELAAKEGVSVNVEDFEAEMENQRKRGRAAWKGETFDFPAFEAETEFLGYDHTEATGKILHLIDQENLVSEVSYSGKLMEPVYVVTDKTPFYPEGGGQLGDQGILRVGSSEAWVTDCKKINGIIVHILSSLTGKLEVGDDIYLAFETQIRSDLAGNHSATHLLNHALMKTLGDHVKQSGSLVHPQYLRFDFTHPKALTKEEIITIEKSVNQTIISAHQVGTEILPKAEAETKGAVMTFGEKYGDTVRVVSMADSIEFCGGTHVKNTADIGHFFIIKESSPGSGNRRIEAITGNAAVREYRNRLKELKENFKEIKKANLPKQEEKALHEIEGIFKKTTQEITIESWQILRNITEDYKKLQKSIKKIEKQNNKTTINNETLNSILQNQEPLGNIDLIVANIEQADIPLLKGYADRLRERTPNLLTILTGTSNGKENLVIATTQIVTKVNNLDLGKLLKQTITESNFAGGGGGRAELAQASGKGVATLQASLLTQLASKANN